MKKFYLIIFTLFISFLFVNNVSASSASISVSSSSKRVIVGNNVTITVKISSSVALGSWQFDVAPSSNLSLISSSFGGLYIKDVVSSTDQKSKTYTFVFRAKSSGNASVSVKNSSAYAYDFSEMSCSNGSTSFTTLTQSELEASYSKNNNLKELSIEGYELNFDENTLEYNLEVPNDVTTVRVNATKADSTASVAGTGEISISEGINTLNVVVTAQNGSTKTYVINLTVKELDPINVKIDNTDYTVIRKAEFMPSVSINYESNTSNIDGNEVPSYYNSKSNTTLVGLKDTNGNSKLFIYDNGNYSSYSETSFNHIILSILDEEINIPNGYNKTSVKIGEIEYNAYKNENSDMYLIYATNVENGEKSLYKYDQLENTVQRYESVENNEQLYLYIIIGLSLFIVLSYIVLLSRKPKSKESIKETKGEHIKNETSIKSIIETPEIELEKPLTKKEIKEQKKLEKENKLKKEEQLKQKFKEDQKARKEEEKKRKKNKESDMAEL